MNRRRMLHALKAEVGEYEDAAVLPAETDPSSTCRGTGSRSRST